MLNRLACGFLALAGVAGAASADVFPTTGHVATNFIIFGSGSSGTPTMHQVFNSALFANASGGQPVTITRIGFAPGLDGVFDLGQVTIRLGYTNLAPQTLAIPTVGGAGAPNASGPMTLFYDNPNTSFNITSSGSNNFSEMVFTGTPFVYNPNLGNLLVEIVVPSPANGTLHVSRAAGSAESSRAFAETSFGSLASHSEATRMDFTFTIGGGCYPDCNGDGALNLADFGCFQTKFALNDPYADCNGDGALNLADFGCFRTKFALGCP